MSLIWFTLLYFFLFSKKEKFSIIDGRVNFFIKNRVDLHNAQSSPSLIMYSCSSAAGLSSVNKISEQDAIAAGQILQNCVNQLQLILCLVVDDKCDHDRGKKLWNFVINSLRLTIEELKSEKTFTFLAKIVDQERQKRNDFNSASRLNKYEKELSKLNDRIAATETSFRTELLLKRRIIEEQTEELQNLKIRNESELEFEKEWLRVQVEENDLKCELQETSIDKKIENLKHEIEEEQKVHKELSWYYKHEQKKVDDLISYWKARYADIEQRKIEIEMLYKKQETQHRELNNYKTMYTKREAEMLEYEADKERRRKEYEYEQYRHKMATKIQAWWRGVMVRRGLGPFKNLLKAKDIKKRKMSLKKNPKK